MEAKLTLDKDVVVPECRDLSVRVRKTVEAIATGDSPLLLRLRHGEMILSLFENPLCRVDCGGRYNPEDGVSVCVYIQGGGDAGHGAYCIHMMHGLSLVPARRLNQGSICSQG